VRLRHLKNTTRKEQEDACSGPLNSSRKINPYPCVRYDQH
jgi:hypothetical protein